MARTPAVRAVKAPPLTVPEAASGGTRRELLTAVRDVLAEGIVDQRTQSRDLGGLTRRLMEVVDEIREIDAAEREEARHAVTARETWDPASL